jgi:hypothetical protein
MIENKENADTETWDDIVINFNEIFDYWIYEIDKNALSVSRILSIQETFSACFSILRQKKTERDYICFAQNMELLRLFLLTKSSDHPVYRRALKERHYK